MRRWRIDDNDVQMDENDALCTMRQWRMDDNDVQIDENDALGGPAMRRWRMDDNDVQMDENDVLCNYSDVTIVMCSALTGHYDASDAMQNYDRHGCDIFSVRLIIALRWRPCDHSG